MEGRSIFNRLHARDIKRHIFAATSVQPKSVRWGKCTLYVELDDPSVSQHRLVRAFIEKHAWEWGVDIYYSGDTRESWCLRIEPYEIECREDQELSIKEMLAILDR